MDDTGLAVPDDNFKPFGGHFRGASGNLAFVNAESLALICQLDDAGFPRPFKFFLHVCKVGIPVVVSVCVIGDDFIASFGRCFKKTGNAAMGDAESVDIELLLQGTNTGAAFNHCRGAFLDDVEVLAVPCHHSVEPYDPEISHCGT